MDSVTSRHFILDGMLGSLSRWLRLLGCSVKYCKRSSDHELLELVSGADHILLTRDLALFRRAKSKGLRVFFIEGRTIPEMLANFSHNFKISLVINLMTSRCSICNAHIEPIKKTAIVDRVPEGTLKHYDAFWRCTGCSKVYWQGSHWKNIKATLQKAKKLREKCITKTER
jgi:uncharacterized protein with PIN domain